MPEKRKGSGKVRHDRQRALNAVRALVATLGGSARAVESQSGLTNAQLFVLRQIADHGTVSINDLAALVHTRQNTVSSVVGRLVAHRLIRKERSVADRRRAALALTPQGRRALAKAPQSSTEALIDAIDSLAASEARALADGLAALVAALGANPDQAPLLFERGELEMPALHNERDVTVSLEAADGSTTSAPGRLRYFSAADRLKRSAVAIAVAVLLAVMFVPIPIIHLLAIPIILVGGAAVAARQMMSVARLHPLRIACPKCGVMNRVGGGLGVKHADRPMPRSCESCRRTLSLRIGTT